MKRTLLAPTVLIVTVRMLIILYGQATVATCGGEETLASMFHASVGPISSSADGDEIDEATQGSPDVEFGVGGLIWPGSRLCRPGQWRV